MASHSWLSLLLVVALATISIALKDDDVLPAAKSNNVLNRDPNIPLADDPRFNKMLPNLPMIDPIDPNDTIKRDPNIPLADDPRFNKMLPNPNVGRVPSIPLADDPRFNKMLPKPNVDVLERNPFIPLADDPRFNKMLPKDNLISDIITSDENDRQDSDEKKDLEDAIKTVGLNDKEVDDIIKPVASQGPAASLTKDDFDADLEAAIKKVGLNEVDTGKTVAKTIKSELPTQPILYTDDLDDDLDADLKAVIKKFELNDAEEVKIVPKNGGSQVPDDSFDADLRNAIKTVGLKDDDSVDSVPSNGESGVSVQSATKNDDSDEDLNAVNLRAAIKEVGLNDSEEEKPVQSNDAQKPPIEVNKLSSSVAPPTSKSQSPSTSPKEKADAFEVTDDYMDNYEYDDDYYDTNTDKSDKGDKPKPIKGSDSDAYDEYSEEEKEDTKKTTTKATIEEEVVYNTNVPCPRNCKCARNMNRFIVAECNRLDAEVQKFGADITDLQVANIDPKFPIVLGAEFFKKIGLKGVFTIKITNCTIEYIHPTAFKGLDNLHSVNLTNTGLDMVHPDTFAENTALRLLTLAGNDLKAMQAKNSPFSNYMLKAPFLEELDISRANLKELLPTAFNGLRSIVYINLSDNQLTTLPENLFHEVLSIEELNLSYNSIAELPKRIFNQTSLSVIDLKYNEISGHLNFINKDVENLDLSYNKISHVNDVLFHGLTGLTNLVLKGNMITKIHQSAFVTLKNLRYIDLSFNDMEQVSSLLFNENNKLDVIKLNDNKRLKKLPLDGFQSNMGSFDVFHLDISNCDISVLGDDTFSTMTQLSTLKLSWNNIESLGKGVFRYLGNLIELDLSNNLLENVNDLIFLHNQKLKKLNLAGNPIEKLSTKIFLPTEQLTELDISNCNLGSVFAESSKTATLKVLKNLQLLNVSNNDISSVMRSDLEGMESLSVLDISNNRLHCNTELNSLTQWLTQRKIKVGNSDSELMSAELNENTELLDDVKQLTWGDFFRGICRRDSTQFKPGTQIVDSKNNNLDDDDEEDDDDTYDDSSNDEDSSDISDDIDDDVLPSVKPAVSKDSKSDEETKLNETLPDDDDSASDDDDDDDDNADDEYYEDDDDEDEDDDDNDDLNMVVNPKLNEKDLIVEEMNIVQGLGNKILELGADEEVVIERGHFFIGRQRFWVPILIVVLSVLVVLILIGKIVSLLMRRRGERYRQALLASKNSIVYQKLSEEIGAGPQTPKFHRYAPINQV